MPSGCTATLLVGVAGISGQSHVCVGDSIQLTSSAGFGGTWSSSTPSMATVDGTTGWVTGVSMGFSTITYSLGTGCTVLWPVSINPLAPIVGPDSICVGSFGYMTDIVGGGTWSVAPVPAGVASILFDSGKVTAIATGITNVSYSFPSGCFTTKPLTVIAYPGPIGGIPNVCPGQTTTLSDAVAGGTWSSANTGIATVDPSTGVVTGVYSDTVDILYTIRPGCPVKIPVIVFPIPDPIIGPDIMCPNTVDTMRDSSYGIWSTLTPSLMSIDTNGIVWALAQGTAIIKYKAPTTCYVTKQVSVQPMPVPTITYNPFLNTMYADGGWLSYQWYDTLEGKVPGATSPSMAALDNEWYQVEVTDSNGCKGKSAKFFFNVSMLSVGNVGNEQIKVYPNPAGNFLNVSAPMKLSAHITDAEGRRVMDIKDAKQIDVSQLASGLYFVDLLDDAGIRVAVRKFTKE